VENIRKRDVAALILGGIAIMALTMWATVSVIDKFVLVHDPSDPLVKAGGLKPEQAIQAK
jgi:hypothetical protein